MQISSLLLYMRLYACGYFHVLIRAIIRLHGRTKVAAAEDPIVKSID